MIVTFLTDFGLEDDFVGTCHGVIKRIAPDAEIIDLTHGIHPGRIQQGALVLANALPYMPAGVHLAVVDPGVGSGRRPLALRDAEGRLYVGPDNGLLLPAADRFGGPLSATVSFACTACGALALLALETSARTTWLGVYAILFGLGFGARGPIITAMASDLFGGRRFGSIYGVLNLGNGLGAALGPWFAGFVHDVTGSYRIVFLASVVFCALGSSCFWVAARRRRIDA